MTGPKHVSLTVSEIPLAEDGSAMVVLARLAGKLPPGSQGNADCALVSEEVTRRLAAVKERAAKVALVVDCTRLDYSWGDALGGMWIAHVIEDGVCAIVAVGRTAEALRSLVLHSGWPQDIPILSRLEDAADHVRRIVAAAPEGPG